MFIVCLKMWLTFVRQSCILQPGSASLFILGVLFAESLGFSTQTTMTSANENSFTALFLMYMPFFYCLTIVGKSYSTVFCNCPKSRYPFLVPNRGGTALVLHPGSTASTAVGR